MKSTIIAFLIACIACFFVSLLYPSRPWWNVIILSCLAGFTIGAISSYLANVKEMRKWHE
jgi:uncharacterized membrane protein (DUF106 family)